MYLDPGLTAFRQRRAPVKHFGETWRASKYSHRLKRDEYAQPNKTNST
jgi:hypothetical protein